MFCCPKSLALAARKWADKGNDDDESGWQFNERGIIAGFGLAAFSVWFEWKKNGTLPHSGGWLDQPLAIIIKMQVIDLIVETCLNWRKEGYIPNATQIEFLRWANKEVA